jgi:hypothetical protein
MRNQEEIEATSKLLARLINDSPCFHHVLPGEPARQFALGVAAGIDYARGIEVRPLFELLRWIKKQMTIPNN